MSIATNPRNAHGINNYGCFLTCVKRNFEAAERYLRMAILVDREQPLHIQNYAIFTHRIKKNKEEGERITKVSQDVEKRQVMRSNNLGKSNTGDYSLNDDDPSKTDKRLLTAAQKVFSLFYYTFILRFCI